MNEDQQQLQQSEIQDSEELNQENQDQDQLKQEEKEQSLLEEAKAKSNDEVYDEWKRYIELRKSRGKE